METKRCTRCKKEKLVTAFSQSNPTKKDGYNSWCKQCCYESSRSWVLTPKGIYSQLKARQTYFKKHNDPRAKPVTISQKDFVSWYEQQDLKCVYCGISEEDFILIKNEYGSRTERLTIDCIDNRIGYAKDNLVLACERCNQIKSNLLSYDEMLYVGQNFIKPKWQTLKNGNGNKNLYLTHY